MEILCLQHVPFEGPARLETWLAGKGVTLRKILVSEEPLPAPADFPAVIVMGGPMNIYQHRDHPWLVAEKMFLRQCLENGTPLLGICLGAQLLADVLGARVVQNPEREIGWFPIQLSTEFRLHFPSLPESLDVLHWHGDTFALPSGAIRIAESAACPEQGFYLPWPAIPCRIHRAFGSGFARPLRRRTHAGFLRPKLRGDRIGPRQSELPAVGRRFCGSPKSLAATASGFMIAEGRNLLLFQQTGV